jgi:hypothetical protein
MWYNAKEHVIGSKQVQWFYEEKGIPLVATNMLLVRVMIGKVTNMGTLLKTLPNIPIVQNNSASNCVTWVVGRVGRVGSALD